MKKKIPSQILSFRNGTLRERGRESERGREGEACPCYVKGSNEPMKWIVSVPCLAHKL